MWHPWRRTHQDGERDARWAGNHDKPDSSDDAARDGYLLSVVVPTKDEAENVTRLVRLLEQATRHVPTEIVFVDDSTDATPATIAGLRERSPQNIRLIHRPPERRNGGLGGAVIEGLRVASAPWVCVMDADLQHPPELVPRLLEEAEQRQADVVVASRYCAKGHKRGFSQLREAVSRSLITLARLLFPARLRQVSDPLSGFFLVRRGALDLDRLRPRGFKILLEILVRTPALSVAEVPFHFGERHAGTSKASLREGLRYLSHLLHLRFSETSVRFAQFGLVGLSGILINQLLLALATEVVGFHYLASAVLATQGSSLWNFSFTELWVFRDRQHRQGVVLRLVLFLGLNNAALTLRGPMLLVLTSGLGIHYLVSNLVSLFALTAVRFALADTWIWGAARRGKSQLDAHRYSIHDIITVTSEARLPELERFRIDALVDAPTIRVRIGTIAATDGRQPAAASESSVRRIRYDDAFGPFGFGIDATLGEQTIEVVASPLLRRSPHVLYTNVVEPILRWTFVEKGYALVHGACIAFGNDAYLVTARTDTGKTTTVLRTLDRYPCSFLSDDLTLVRPDGRVLTYPKPLTVSRHTVSAVSSPLLSRWQRLTLPLQSRVHSRSGRWFAQLIAKTRLPAATINAIVQLLIPPPKYQVDKLVPGVAMARDARLAGLIVIARGNDDTTIQLGPQEALDVLMANCEDAYGFPPYHEIEGFLHSSNGRNLRPIERAIVARALEGVPATLLESTKMDWWQRLPAILNRDGREMRSSFRLVQQPEQV